MPDYRLAIIGYGKMGKLVEHLAPQYGFDIAVKLDVDNNAGFEGLTRENFVDIDAAQHMVKHIARDPDHRDADRNT